MFRTDRPIQSSRDDILGRSTFAKALGKAILGYQDKESIVVGLFGPWGSGKTSIVNMFLEYVKQDVHDIPADTQPIVIHFNPWIYSDQGQIVPQYFKQVGCCFAAFGNIQDDVAPDWVIKGGRVPVIFPNQFTVLANGGMD